MENIKIKWSAARVNCGLNQKEVAKILKISPQTLVSWENYKTSPTVIQAQQLSELYKIPLDNIQA